jgi:hypothetical protein
MHIRKGVQINLSQRHQGVEALSAEKNEMRDFRLVRCSYASACSFIIINVGCGVNAAR